MQPNILSKLFIFTLFFERSYSMWYLANQLTGGVLDSAYNAVVAETCQSLFEAHVNKTRIKNGAATIDAQKFVSYVASDPEQCKTAMRAFAAMIPAAESFEIPNFSTKQTFSSSHAKLAIVKSIVGGFKDPHLNILLDFDRLPNLEGVIRSIFDILLMPDGTDHKIVVQIVQDSNQSLGELFPGFSVASGSIGNDPGVVSAVYMQKPSFGQLLKPYRMDHRAIIQSPELIFVPLSMQSGLKDNEAILVSGFSTVTKSKAGDPIATWKNRQCIFMDATTYTDATVTDQYSSEHFDREISKASAAFGAVPQGQIIEVGYWGCGPAQRGNKALRVIIQFLAASKSGHRLSFKLYGAPDEEAKEIKRMLESLAYYTPCEVSQTLKYHVLPYCQSNNCDFLDLITHLLFELNTKVLDIDTASCETLFERYVNSSRSRYGNGPVDARIFVGLAEVDTAVCKQAIKNLWRYVADIDQLKLAGNTCSKHNACVALAKAIIGGYEQPINNVCFTGAVFNSLLVKSLLSAFLDSHVDPRVFTAKKVSANVQNYVGTFFRAFSVQEGSIGEDANCVSAVYMQSNTFGQVFDTYRMNHRFILRNLDLVVVPLTFGNLEANEAVFASGFLTCADSKGNLVTSSDPRSALFMDAPTYDQNSMYAQYEWKEFIKTLGKAVVAFSAAPKDKPIEVGYWGCGPAQRGDKLLRLIIQILAASHSGHELRFKLFQADHMEVNRMDRILKEIAEHSPQQVLKALYTTLPICRKNQESLINNVKLLLEQLASTVDDAKEGSITYHDLCMNSDIFEAAIHFLPVKSNKVQVIAGDDREKQTRIAEQANKVRILAHTKVLKLIVKFLEYKTSRGSIVEKDVYAGMDLNGFIDRLFKKRPLVFMTRSDYTLLRSGTLESSAHEKWALVGTENEAEPYVLRDYLSYEEMELAAMIGLASPTYFINNGNRNNSGGPSTKNDFVPEGIYIGMVGARFEIHNKMESKYMALFKDVEYSADKYGPGTSDAMMQEWAHFYNTPYFPSYAEISGLASEELLNRAYVRTNGGLLNLHTFKMRLQMSLEPVLLYANEEAKKQGKMAAIRWVGLGLGVWAIENTAQCSTFVDLIKELTSKHDLPNVGFYDFMWMEQASYAEASGTPYKFVDAQGHEIKYVHGKHNPADPLPKPEGGKEWLLVALYAWDGNSFPGNEYWARMFTASGDPAAACHSTIQQLQNVYINTSLRAETKLSVYGSDD